MNDNSTRRRKHGVRLYNVLFPMWMFYLFPTWLWLVILPANFAIDSLVLCLAMRKLEISGRREIWRKSIFRIWAFGFLSDFLGALLTLGLMLMIDAAHLSWDVYLFPGTTLLAIPGVVLSGALIYMLNKRYAFVKCMSDERQVHKLSLALAVFTAPYAMLIPLYG